MKLRRSVTTAAATGLLAATLAVAAQPASATVVHRYWCSATPTGNQICNREAGQLSLQGWHVTRVHYNPPGCTAPDGCWAGYYFDYWR